MTPEEWTNETDRMIASEMLRQAKHHRAVFWRYALAGLLLFWGLLFWSLSARAGGWIERDTQWCYVDHAGDTPTADNCIEKSEPDVYPSDSAANPE